ncbi:hypothetical protein JGS22_012455 [Streptomyces sp. P38-E01]|uniref:Uncharacterized protein n=1 Tax=Streptomyces tardus TaxID=2780544 RepID=A0A949JE45_9ACTN|nr:hypothetical protein [Streptomyces tardus]MBU7598403.1 hypothetical protein [Streptomyces tardus]
MRPRAGLRAAAVRTRGAARAAPGGDADSTQFLPPQSDSAAHLPQQPHEGMDATQYIPAQQAQLPGPLPESTPAHAADPYTPEPHAADPYSPEPYSPGPYAADRTSGGSPSGSWHPAAPGGDADSTQFLPPQSDSAAHLPQQPHEGMDATQYIPAQQAQEMDATQFIPPQSGEALDATQVIPPYADGPSGPQQPGSAPHGPHGHEPQKRSAQNASDRPVPEAPGRAPYGIRPGAPGDRQPPAEFEMLFRPDNGDRPAGRAGRLPDSGTQPLPVFENAVASQSASTAPRKDTLGAPEPTPRSRRAGASGGQNGGHGGSGGHGGGSGGGRRRPLLIGAGGLALLVAAGLLGGAALGGGDDDGKEDKAGSSSQADEDKDPEPSPEPSEEKPDPAEAQAKELDKLLADSNNSRDAVIRSVENIKKCEKLPEAAADLKDAAAQRNSLVVRLDKLTLDKVPQHQALTDQLRKAWRASESADKHYASWANEVRRPQFCKDGKARHTPHLARGNRESGTATKAKVEAAKLWNPTARAHKLPERQPTQL